jgi:transcriptional repressor NrdR
MRCIYCGCEESRVIDSRSTEDGNSIRRRRECENCGRRFTTYEKIDTIPLMVVKKDRRREPFDSEKLRQGIIKACEKRPVSMAAIEEMLSAIETRIQSQFDREVATEQLGELVMERLKEMDEVAYVRFASVYRQFRDIETFMDELSKLLVQKS